VLHHHLTAAMHPPPTMRGITSTTCGDVLLHCCTSHLLHERTCSPPPRMLWWSLESPVERDALHHIPTTCCSSPPHSYDGCLRPPNGAHERLKGRYTITPSTGRISIPLWIMPISPVGALHHSIYCYCTAASETWTSPHISGCMVQREETGCTHPHLLHSVPPCIAAMYRCSATSVYTL
jgi:hypothetical protein